MTTSISSIIGQLFFSANDNFITEITLEKREESGTTPLLERAKSELDEYFKGLRKDFDLPLDLHNLTQFQQKVLISCRKIPYGQTVTYADIARDINSPKASRAVGNALHNNPIMIVIPCHRVLAKNNIGGFGSGIEIKNKLLILESEQKTSS